MVGENTQLLDRLLPAHRHCDADRDIRQVPQPRGVHLVVVAPPIDQAAGEQRANDLDRLPEHVLPLRDSRPPFADHVLVEVLAAAQAQGEPPVGEDLHGRGLLRDDRGVITHGRARHVGVEVDPFSDLRYCSQQRPRVGRVTLRCQPRRKMITADLEVEPSIFSRNCISDKVFGAVLLCHQGIAKLRHLTRVPRHGRGKRRPPPKAIVLR